MTSGSDNTTPGDTIEIERLALLVARLQAKHNARSDDEARQISLDAIRSWGEPVPSALLDPARATR